MTIGELLDQIKYIDREYEIAIGDYTIENILVVPAIKEVKFIRTE